MRPTSLREDALAVCLGLGLTTAENGQAAAADTAGTSGLPWPHFVSLKADRVNVCKGPGTDYPIALVFEKAGLPVEVVREYGIWRQIRFESDRDVSEGTLKIVATLRFDVKYAEEPGVAKAINVLL